MHMNQDFCVYLTIQTHRHIARNLQWRGVCFEGVKPSKTFSLGLRTFLCPKLGENQKQNKGLYADLEQFHARK